MHERRNKHTNNEDEIYAMTTTTTRSKEDKYTERPRINWPNCKPATMSARVDRSSSFFTTSTSQKTTTTTTLLLVWCWPDVLPAIILMKTMIRSRAKATSELQRYTSFIATPLKAQKVKFLPSGVEDKLAELRVSYKSFTISFTLSQSSSQIASSQTHPAHESRTKPRPTRV